MKAVNSLHYSSPSSSSSSSCAPHLFTAKWPLIFPQNSFSVKRRRSRRTNRSKKFNYTPLPDSDDAGFNNQNLKLVLDVDQISSVATSKLHRFMSSSRDAYNDLRTLVTVDENNRIVFSCRKSTLRFTGFMMLCGFVLVLAFRVAVQLGLGFRNRFLGSGRKQQKVVVRRDRSLGGREVVVAVDEVGREGNVKSKKSSRVLDNPLSLPDVGMKWDLGKDDWRRYRVLSHQKLPEWWPVKAKRDQLLVENQDEYQREANRLIRAITDYRTSGRDVMEHHIIQLRQICRTSGVQVSFGTTNTRDAFYRTSIDFVLNVCCSAPSYSTFVEIDGEDVQQFIAGLAQNIGLENTRAARMVSAAVAARTRSWFLQAWALEVQGKHSEAVFELTKICLVLRTFPPEESSPEMEMVARGLGKHLRLEQRELLMNMFVEVCGGESHKSAAYALGLTAQPMSTGDQLDSMKS